MSTLRLGMQQLRCVRQTPNLQLQKPQWPLASASQSFTRNLTTERRGNQRGGSRSTDIDPMQRMEALALGESTWAAIKQEEAQLAFSPEVMAASGIRPRPAEPFKDLEHVRPVPSTPSYFTRQPYFNDLFIKISKMFKEHERLPTMPPERVPPQLWKDIGEFKAVCGEPLKGVPFTQLMKMVKKLHTIEPSLMPPEVAQALREFKRGVNPYTNTARPIVVDNYGRALGTGRRKTSTARAWVVEGSGEVQVNGMPISQTFGRIHDRESALWALYSTERVDKYNVWALVEGGGTTGQAEALTLAIAKALLAHEPGLKTALRQAGCITRDTRHVERKKHGHVKARKMPAWNRR